MQEVLHESVQSSGARIGNEADGLLESPAEVTITHCGLEMARLWGLSTQVGSLMLPVGSSLSLPCGVELQLYAAERLYWTHTGAMRLLHGMTPRDVLGPEWIIINGVTTRPGDPSPGIRMPILARVLGNPSGTAFEEVFKQTWLALGLSSSPRL